MAPSVKHYTTPLIKERDRARAAKFREKYREKRLQAGSHASGLFVWWIARGHTILEKLLGLRTEGVTAKSEILAGVTVFFTMTYILFVNPQILSAAGMDRGAVFMATVIAAALTTLLMCLYAF